MFFRELFLDPQIAFYMILRETDNLVRSFGIWKVLNRKYGKMTELFIRNMHVYKSKYRCR